MPHVEPKEETIAIRTPYITRGQLLKYADLIDEGEYVICYYCKSIVPKRMTVTVNDGFWKGSIVCPDCLRKILSK